MKKCPFCAEEIQDEAVKCRYCNSNLSAAAPPVEAAALADGGQAPLAGAPFAKAREPQAGLPKLLYQGSPSAGAYAKQYSIITMVLLVVLLLVNWIAKSNQFTTKNHVLINLVPLIIGILVFVGMSLYRKATRIRVTSANIEIESGILSKSIDVIELWRCRDVRYRQNLVDRIFGVAHIDIITTDATTPNIEMRGLPASRILFEQIRDNIALQRQAQNVYGVVQ